VYGPTVRVRVGPHGSAEWGRARRITRRVSWRRYGSIRPLLGGFHGGCKGRIGLLVMRVVVLVSRSGVFVWVMLVRQSPRPSGVELGTRRNGGAILTRRVGWIGPGRGVGVGVEELVYGCRMPRKGRLMGFMAQRPGVDGGQLVDGRREGIVGARRWWHSIWDVERLEGDGRRQTKTVVKVRGSRDDGGFLSLGHI